jgi:hypothetical protein
MTQRDALPSASVPGGGYHRPIELPHLETFPGAACLPSHRAAMLQSGLPDLASRLARHSFPEFRRRSDVGSFRTPGRSLAPLEALGPLNPRRVCNPSVLLSHPSSALALLGYPSSSSTVVVPADLWRNST